MGGQGSAFWGGYTSLENATCSRDDAPEIFEHGSIMEDHGLDFSRALRKAVRINHPSKLFHLRLMTIDLIHDMLAPPKIANTYTSIACNLVNTALNFSNK